MVSGTALGNAYVRAFHTRWDPAPIFADPYSGLLLKDEEAARFRSSILTSYARHSPHAAEDDCAAVAAWIATMSASSPHVLLRARAANEALHAALDDNVRQCLILGSGLDTTAAQLASAGRVDVMVVEMDNRETQQSKRERLSAVVQRLPRHELVPLTVGRDDLVAAIDRSGLSTAEPVFVSLCGLSYYLGAGVLFDMLEALVRLWHAEVRVVMDYWDARYTRAEVIDEAVASLFASVARGGEPFRSAFDPAALATDLGRRGYVVADDVDDPELATRFAPDKQDWVFRPFGRVCHTVFTPTWPR